MNTAKLSVPTAMNAIVAYVLLLIPSLLLAAYIWATKVSGVLYLCTDSLGIFDFIPPFVHPGTGDVYYASVWKLYSLWYALMGVALLAPAALIGFLWHKWRKEEDWDG
jgi:hypothetical protein